MRKIIVILAVIFFSTPCFVLASLEISEIMYDLKTGSDDGREWVEIFNNGSETVNLANWKISDTNFDDVNITARGYVVVSRNLTEGILLCPDDSIFEIKFPAIDIKGSTI